jgi:TorA maturation chaperone TorD
LNCLRYEEEFIGKHVAGWAAVFCAKVKDGAELSFYREMAGLTAAFLASEQPEIARRKRIAERKG